MNRTKIEWCDYTINPVKGLCPMACSYCYARKMYKRFKWNPEIRFEPLDYIRPPDGSKVFVGSTMELFGSWVKDTWLDQTFEWCKRLPKVTFIFLTKQPQNLINWSPFPENVWVGASVTNQNMANEAIPLIMNSGASVRFVSIEPFLEQIDLTKLEFGRSLPENTPYYVSGLEDRFIFGDEGDIELLKLNWLIIGSRTQPTQHPPREWVDEIITAADKAKIPVFVKEPMASHYNIHRQEFPLANPIGE